MHAYDYYLDWQVFLHLHIYLRGMVEVVYVLKLITFH